MSRMWEEKDDTKFEDRLQINALTLKCTNGQNYLCANEVRMKTMLSL